MYWSNFSRKEYETILRKLGFSLSSAGTPGHGYGPEYVGKVEHHPVILGRKLP